MIFSSNIFIFFAHNINICSLLNIQYLCYREKIYNMHIPINSSLLEIVKKWRSMGSNFYGHP